jgi:hypothetical protein
MITKYLFACLPVLLCIQGWSQDQEFNWEKLGENSNRLEGKLSGTIYHLPLDANSTHFFHDKWVKGMVILEDGDIFNEVNIRYLAYGDELVVFNSNLGQLFIADKEKVKSFSVDLNSGTQKFVKISNTAEGGEERYFELLYSGTNWLLAFHFLFDEKTDVYRDDHGKLKDTRLILKTAWYMYDTPNEKLIRLQNKRKAFINLAGIHKKEARKLFRQNQLHWYNSFKMVKAFELMDKAGFFQ